MNAHESLGFQVSDHCLSRKALHRDLKKYVKCQSNRQNSKESPGEDRR